MKALDHFTKKPKKQNFTVQNPYTDVRTLFNCEATS